MASGSVDGSYDFSDDFPWILKVLKTPEESPACFTYKNSFAENDQDQKQKSP